MAKQKIVLLSLDGGGARGTLAAEVLRLFEHHHNLDVRACFDFYAGVSTGALIAAYCATNENNMDYLATHIYSTENLNRVFDKSIWDRLLGRMQNQPKYDGRNKQTHIETLMGDMRMNEVTDKHLLILAYDFINRELLVFKNKGEAYNPTLAEVCNAATAAPTLYPPVSTNEPHRRWLIDGAIATNDPSMMAIVEAMAMGYALDDIWMVSIGTGRPVHDLDQRQKDKIGHAAEHWGVIGWIANGLVDHMMLGSSSVSAYQCQQLLGDRYVRINGYLPRPLLQLDNAAADNLAELRDHAFAWYEQFAEPVVSMVQRVYGYIPATDHALNHKEVSP